MIRSRFSKVTEIVIKNKGSSQIPAPVMVFTEHVYHVVESSRPTHIDLQSNQFLLKVLLLQLPIV